MQPYQLIGIGSVILGLISLALPWAEARFLGFGKTIYGFTTDGVISFILLVVCLGLLLTKGSKWKAITIIVLSLIGLGVTVATIVNAYTSLQQLGPLAEAIVSWGPGIELMIIATLGMLIASILFLRYQLKPRIWGAPSDQYSPIWTEAESASPMQTAVESPRGAGAVTARPALPAQKVRVEVVAMGSSIVCRRCGRESPLTSSSCTSCGAAFRKATYGLRCPACSAPLKIAKRISADRFVCSQCFSDLRVYLAS
jgi:ribosomal protein L37E